MTPEQKETLHRILLDAKAEIKDGRLLKHNGIEAAGICGYVDYHQRGGETYALFACNLYNTSPLYKGGGYIATPFDFSHPDRLALLDYLIESTKS